MIFLAVKPPLCYATAMPKLEKETRDFLLRGLPVEMADKLKVAASLHRKAMREYLLDVLEAHLKELERRGITLTLLPKGK
jgi:plasmid stability protein